MRRDAGEDWRKLVQAQKDLVVDNERLRKINIHLAELILDMDNRDDFLMGVIRELRAQLLADDMAIEIGDRLRDTIGAILDDYVVSINDNTLVMTDSISAVILKEYLTEAELLND
ncbi:hypothetical protein LCGC14_2436100 [marine sediment metagenome]|uniref:Uncharacterized protein n=1 Tax=marine sediment metagenome TaxID=412755 RepID=A0A0F9DXG9_9ZZZZ